MQTLGLCKKTALSSPPKKPFWRRQFRGVPSRAQKEFDWAFGVVLPLICFAADPIVFRGGPGEAILGEYKIFAYSLGPLSILAMTAWLLWGARLGEFRGFLGGLFLVSSLVSFAVGVAIFPYSLIGSIALIGLLGFTPLFSGFVYLRNSSRAILGAGRLSTTGYLWRAALLAAIYGLVAPLVLNSMAW